jgi:hypothetical protein
MHFTGLPDERLDIAKYSRRTHIWRDIWSYCEPMNFEGDEEVLMYQNGSQSGSGAWISIQIWISAEQRNQICFWTFSVHLAFDALPFFHERRWNSQKIRPIRFVRAMGNKLVKRDQIALSRLPADETDERLVAIANLGKILSINSDLACHFCQSPSVGDMSLTVREGG